MGKITIIANLIHIYIPNIEQKPYSVLALVLVEVRRM